MVIILHMISRLPRQKIQMESVRGKRVITHEDAPVLLLLLHCCRHAPLYSAILILRRAVPRVLLLLMPFAYASLVSMLSPHLVFQRS